MLFLSTRPSATLLVCAIAALLTTTPTHADNFGGAVVIPPDLTITDPADDPSLTLHTLRDDTQQYTFNIDFPTTPQNFGYENILVPYDLGTAFQHINDFSVRITLTGVEPTSVASPMPSSQIFGRAPLFVTHSIKTHMLITESSRPSGIQVSSFGDELYMSPAEAAFYQRLLTGTGELEIHPRITADLNVFPPVTEGQFLITSLTITVDGVIPEPASLTLLSLAAPLALRRRPRR